MTIAPMDFFGRQPAVEASAPGRVNLLGEHTDYNDGFVLPIAIPQKTHVALDPSQDDRFHLYSANLDEIATFNHGSELPEGFARYVEGCMRVLREQGLPPVPPLNIYVSSGVPMGSGLSSSAALEVAVLRALRDLLDLPLDDVQIAQLAQQAEIRYAGVQCGIMDQMASSLCDTENMLFLDTRTLERRLLPFPGDAELIVLDSGVARTLATSKYNERRAECHQAAKLLGVGSLRDVTDATGLEKLPQIERKRAMHVVTENARVLDAIRPGLSAEEFGKLMDASHASLKDDYEVSIPALDILCDMLRDEEGVHGARLTGAGFGGACIALCRNGLAFDIAERVVKRYNAEHPGAPASVLLPVPPD
jgi:galactokinase